MENLIITGLMATFCTEVPFGVGKSHVGSDDVRLDDFLRAKVDYGDFILRPIIIMPEEGRLVPDVLFLQNSKPIDSGRIVAGCRFIEARYHIQLKQPFGYDRVLDALNASISFLTRNSDHSISLIPFDIMQLPESRTVNKKNFETWIADYREIPVQQVELWGVLDAASYGGDFDQLIFQLASNVLKDDVLLYAMLFFREALLSSEEILGDTNAILKAPAEKPFTISESVKMENSLHNYYKVIEAIHGGTLPERKSKILSKFSNKGINLETLIGYENETIDKERAIDKLLKLRKIRNERAAHGRVYTSRKSSFYEVIDFRELCDFVLSESIKQRIGLDTKVSQGYAIAFKNSKL